MITKALIPAAGFGTRMLPAAKAVPKELLPVLDKPTIQYVVEECAAAGIDDVLMITGRDKKAIEDHFDRNAELESRLSAGKKLDLLRSVLELAEKTQVHAVRQPEQKGLGHAVLMGKRHIGREPFLCLLGDTIFSGESPAKQLVDAYARHGTAVIGVERVAPEKIERYGVVGGEMVSEDVMRLTTLVEKPPRDSAPSNLAIAARYVLTPEIFSCLERTPPGKGGEIQLTDAIKLLLSEQPVHAVILKGKRHDIGNPIDWLKTNLVYAARDPQTFAHLAPLMKSLLEIAR
jgi:UTP--glucose-1-phosphate uridylyltransferase